MTKPPRITVLASIELRSGVSAKDEDRHGFVQVSMQDNDGNVMIGQLDAAEARKHGLYFLEVAECAIQDSALFRLLTTKVGVPEAEAGRLIADLREFRQDMDQSDG